MQIGLYIMDNMDDWQSLAYYTSLENLRPERVPGFESLVVRHRWSVGVMVSHHSAKVAVVYSAYAFESHTLRHNASYMGLQLSWESACLASKRPRVRNPSVPPYALLFQLAEKNDSKSFKYRFESYVRHQINMGKRRRQRVALVCKTSTEG